jgi:hypothetical protein
MLRSVLFALALTPLLAQGSAFAQSSAFQRNIDRPGLDYRSFDLSGDATVCQSACRGDRRCHAWTWVRSGVQGPSPRCWLKTSVPQPVRNGCCTSGVITFFD